MTALRCWLDRNGHEARASPTWHSYSVRTIVDLAVSTQPYEPGSDVFCDFAHAPCPTTREEALGLLHVIDLIGPDRREIHWRGYCVAEPAALADLTPEDRAAWDEWVATPKLRSFLDEVLDLCQSQAEANRKKPGFMAFSSRKPG